MVLEVKRGLSRRGGGAKRPRGAAGGGCHWPQVRALWTSTTRRMDVLLPNRAWPRSQQLPTRTQLDTHPRAGGPGSRGLVQGLHVLGLFALPRAQHAWMRRESERCHLGALSLSLNKYDFVRFMKNNIACYFS